jgi:rubredoxin
MTDFPLFRVLVRGGIISPADLLKVMDASEAAGNRYIMFGSRQEIFFPLTKDVDPEAVELTLLETDLGFLKTQWSRLNDAQQPRNVVSSYVALNVMDTTWWAKGDVYHYLLAGFDYQPKLKISIVDPLQSLVPLFTGNLHFVASQEEYHWHLYTRLPGFSARVERWPGLIHGDDVAALARRIEDEWSSAPDRAFAELYRAVNRDGKFVYKHAHGDLTLPTAFFPYYEGLNAMSNNLYWLGLYWRNNRFDTEFLRAACHLCQETKVGKISITPWKSFVIKGIRAGDRILWEKLTSTFGLNLRHSSLELNWHVPVMDDEALELKNYLVRELDQGDISTHGLTFSVIRSGDMTSFTSVVIELHDQDAKGQTRYNVWYAQDFDPNRAQYHLFVGPVRRESLPNALLELSRRYSRQINTGPQNETKVFETDDPLGGDHIHRCGECLTTYNRRYGEPSAGIQAGTPFEALPDDYACYVCSAGRDQFIPVGNP